MTDSNTPAEHNSSYILNREYFTECFDESANTTEGLNAYRKALLLLIGAGIFFIIDIDVYVAWFLLALASVETLSVRYRRSWWVARQMISRAAGKTVKIRINDQGIFTDNSHHQRSILWEDVAAIKQTGKGFIITHNQGNTYLSKKGLDEDFLTFLVEKADAVL